MHFVIALDEIIGKNALLYRMLITKPVKKISSKKTKAEKTNEAKAAADPAKKTPLVHPATKTTEKEEEKVAVAAGKEPLPVK